MATRKRPGRVDKPRRRKNADRDPRDVLPLYQRASLLRFQKALSRIAERRRWPQGAAPQLFARLSTSLRLLTYLHRYSAGALSWNADAQRRFAQHLRDISARMPGHGNAARHLLERRANARPGCGCRERSYVTPVAGMSAIYMASFATFGRDKAGLTQAFDVVAWLSVAHGHLEVANSTLVRNGIDGLDQSVNWAMDSGNPFFQFDPLANAGSAGEGGGLDGPGWGGDLGPEPLPGSPPRDPPDDIDWGPHPLGDHPLLGDELFPPFPDEEEFIRQGCEGLLIDALNGEAPNQVYLSGQTSWSDNIDSIELTGSCAGDTFVVHGHHFGEPQPNGVALVVSTTDGCVEVDVADGDWTQTQITTVLPGNVTSGPVGFFDRLAMQSFNAWVGATNNAASDILVASGCLGTPLTFPTLQTREGITCPPATSVNVIAAGPPLIRHFAASTETATGNELLIDPDDEISFAWLVDNAETVQLWRTSARGPGFPGGTPWGIQEVVNVTGTSLDIGSSGHTEFDTYTYQLRATNSCATVVATVTLYAAKRPNLAIESIEITQAIQTPERDVLLVAGKPTVVRVFATHDMAGIQLDPLPGVRGRMRVFNDAMPDGSVWMAPINGSTANPPEPVWDASIELPSAPVPGNTDDTLNFLIPAALCDGDIAIEVEVSVAGAGIGPAEQGFDDTVSAGVADVKFRPRRPLRIRYIPVTVTSSGTAALPPANGVSNPPTPAQCEALIEESLQQIPTTASISQHPDYAITLSLDLVTISTPFGDFTTPLQYDILGNFHLEWIRLIRTCGLVDISNSVCPDDEDTIWAIIVPSIGGWGRAHIGGYEYITPYRVGTAAHELAHCLNQSHLEVNCPNGSMAPQGEDPADWPNGGAVVDVGFDIINNRAFASTPRFDLMTYCNNRWVTPRRWHQMFSFIGE